MLWPTFLSLLSMKLFQDLEEAHDCKTPPQRSHVVAGIALDADGSARRDLELSECHERAVANARLRTWTMSIYD